MNGKKVLLIGSCGRHVAAAWNHHLEDWNNLMDVNLSGQSINLNGRLH